MHLRLRLGFTEVASRLPILGVIILDQRRGWVWLRAARLVDPSTIHCLEWEGRRKGEGVLAGKVCNVKVT